MAHFNEWSSTLLSPVIYVRLTNRNILILDVFSKTSSFGLETNRTASCEIDLKKIKT